MSSNQHLYRCLDTLKLDPNISEETKIIMFVEYARLVSMENKTAEWHSAKHESPFEYGRYEVYRAKADKLHYETWNGTGWAYGNNEITHWREIKKPNLYTK